MTDRIKVKVTQESIDYAVPRDSSKCMIADTLRSMYPDAGYIDVDLQTIRISRPKLGKRYTYLTPRVAQIAIVQFDKGIKPEPFEFTLRSPQVTPSGSRRIRKELMKTLGLEKEKEISPEQKAKVSAAIKEGMAKARNTKRKIMSNFSESVSKIEGGKPPPLQTTLKDVPYSKRRLFGLRALDI